MSVQNGDLFVCFSKPQHPVIFCACAMQISPLFFSPTATHDLTVFLNEHVQEISFSYRGNFRKQHYPLKNFTTVSRLQNGSKDPSKMVARSFVNFLPCKKLFEKKLILCDRKNAKKLQCFLRGAKYCLKPIYKKFILTLFLQLWF